MKVLKDQAAREDWLGKAANHHAQLALAQLAAHPLHIDPFYNAALLRGPMQPLLPIQQFLAQVTAPLFK